MATVFFMNINSGMRPHAHIQAHCERLTHRHKEAERQRGNFSRRHSCGYSANAGICHCLVWCDVPTSLLRVYCSEPLTYTMLGKRSGGPLSSAPFTKQPLWSEARIRMIMWTLATVYQQGVCSEPAASERTALCLCITSRVCRCISVAGHFVSVH